VKTGIKARGVPCVSGSRVRAIGAARSIVAALAAPPVSLTIRSCLSKLEKTLVFSSLMAAWDNRSRVDTVQAAVAQARSTHYPDAAQPAVLDPHAEGSGRGRL